MIDAHGHIGRFDERNVEPAQLVRYLTAAKIDMVLTANLAAASRGPGACDLDEPDANYAALAAHRAAARLVPLYWVRPGRFDSNLHAFAGALDTEPFAGAFFAPALNGYAADGAVLGPYLAVLARLRKPAVVLTDASDAARPLRVYRLAQRHPGVPVVLTTHQRDVHVPEAFDCVMRSLRRRDARLFVCSAYATRDEIAGAARAAGEDHLLFGSDAPRGAEHARQVQADLSALRQTLSPTAFRKLTRDNAARIFHLDEASASGRPAPAAATSQPAASATSTAPDA